MVWPLIAMLGQLGGAAAAGGATAGGGAATGVGGALGATPAAASTIPTSFGASEAAAAGTIAGQGVMGQGAVQGASAMAPALTNLTKPGQPKSGSKNGAKSKEMFANLMAQAEAAMHPRKVAHQIRQIQLDYPDTEFDTKAFLAQIKDPKYRDQLKQYLG